MPTALRTTLHTALISLCFGCSFFSIDNPDSPLPPKKAATAGKGGAPGASGKVGVSGTGPGAGGSASGSGGTGGSGMAGTGGSSVAGTGGDTTTAGTGGVAGSDTTAGAGGSSAGMPSLGGMGGMAGNDVSTAGSGMTAGASAGGSAGAAAVDCSTISNSKSFGGHCYLLVTNAVNFAAAKMDCASKQAHLVTISNGDPPAQATFDAEDQFVYGLAGGKDTWLGLADGKSDHDPGDGTPYTWIDGEPNPPDSWGKAYGWQSGEPNNYQKPCMNGDTCYEHCGFMLSDQGDKWNDDLCESTKQYVCEWDMTAAPAQ
jgi:hypothetical protein